MRIAILFEFGSQSGGEHSMLAVLDRLRGTDMEFIALAPSEGPLNASLRASGISPMAFDVRLQSGSRRPRGELLAELRGKLLESRCDLVHANSLSMGRLTGAIAEELPMPVTAHLRDIIKLSRAATRDLNRNTRLIAVSEAAREFHIAQGLLPEQVRTIYNGVDTDRFQLRESDGSLKRELGLSAEDLLVLTVGQIGLRKGQDILAEAAVRLAPRLPCARYLLAGQRLSEKQESRDFEQRVIQTFGHLGEGHLQLLGYRDDMPKLMNAADLLVHPANQEPLGRVLLEAAAAGLPIVATHVGGTAEILQGGESALLVPPGDPEALAEAILQMAADPALRTRLAANARRRILEKFPIAEAAENLAAFWKDAASERN